MYLDILIPTAKLSYLNIVLIHTFDQLNTTLFPHFLVKSEFCQINLKSFPI